MLELAPRVLIKFSKERGGHLFHLSFFGLKMTIIMFPFQAFFIVTRMGSHFYGTLKLNIYPKVTKMGSIIGHKINQKCPKVTKMGPSKDISDVTYCD